MQKWSIVSFIIYDGKHDVVKKYTYIPTQNNIYLVDVQILLYKPLY